MHAIRSIKAVPLTVAENEPHPTQVPQWRTQMLEAVAKVIRRGTQTEDAIFPPTDGFREELGLQLPVRVVAGRTWDWIALDRGGYA